MAGIANGKQAPPCEWQPEFFVQSKIKSQLLKLPPNDRLAEIMSPLDIERLKQQYAGKRVVVEAARPQMAQLAGKAGRVVTVNHSGLALVRLDGADAAWHDIDPKFLRMESSP